MIEKFVRESNAIEGITRAPLPEEISELQRFMALDRVTIQDLCDFVKVYEPEAKLRLKYGMDVCIGKYFPPLGGPEIRTELENLLMTDLSAYYLHIHYENLHPFMDCNGRSGRALWAWKHKDLSLGFLHAWYYQSLDNSYNPYS